MSNKWYGILFNIFLSIIFHISRTVIGVLMLVGVASSFVIPCISLYYYLGEIVGLLVYIIVALPIIIFIINKPASYIGTFLDYADYLEYKYEL